MNASENYHPYSWHQSHDQATVLLILPYDVHDEDVQIVIERSHLIAGVRGEPPLIKGRLYADVDPTHSDWLLEPGSPTLSIRERTVSTTSTASTHSSFALVSSYPDIEITSSFAASLASGANSDADETTSPSASSPHSSADERAAGYSTVRRRRRAARAPHSSRGGSPPDAAVQSLASSVSSLDSSRREQGRLLTLHLEKADSAIWPALVVGPAPISLSPPLPGPSANETAYNMDPTSLTLLGLELADVRDEKDRAFEHFTRAWLHARVPSAAMRLVSHYVSPHSLPADLASLPFEERAAYCVRTLGGVDGLAQLYLCAGLLHLEGSARPLLASSHSPLASIRLPDRSPGGSGNGSKNGGNGGGGAGGGAAAAWKQDRAAAARYFERARSLAPEMDVPLLLPESESEPVPEIKLEMPRMDVEVRTPKEDMTASRASARRGATDSEIDGAWYLYLPGLVGAGTALLVVGVVGAIGFTSWRRNQN